MSRYRKLAANRMASSPAHVLGCLNVLADFAIEARSDKAKPTEAKIALS